MSILKNINHHIKWWKFLLSELFRQEIRGELEVAKGCICRQASTLEEQRCSILDLQIKLDHLQMDYDEADDKIVELSLQYNQQIKYTWEIEKVFDACNSYTAGFFDVNYAALEGGIKELHGAMLISMIEFQYADVGVPEKIQEWIDSGGE